MSTKNTKGRLTEKSIEGVAEKLTIPMSVPELNSGTTLPKLTKLLLNVTVQRSLGPVHVLISPESTVGDLITAALRQYSKEGRRPIISSLNPPEFDLHYSQFCFERLSPDEKLNELGTRNFFLCPKQAAVTVAGSSGGHGGIEIGYGGTTDSPPSISTCSKETEEEIGGGAVWLRFMEFML